MNAAGWLGGVLALQTELGDGFWMPGRGSTTAGQVDWLFNFILWISLFFFALIVVLMVLFVVRYHQRPGHRAQETPHHNLALEITWSVIPLILVIIIFWVGFKTYLDMSVAPQNTYEVLVTAQKWQWLFTYPNGWIDEELHVPAGQPVQLVMTSDDVIHSLYVPDFRLKKDVVPGRYTKAWFQAVEPGEHVLFCAEYCGTGHSDMLSRVVVHTPADFEQWLENAASFYDELPPAEAGEQMLKKYGCVQCHSVDGSAGTGPTLKDSFGEMHAMTDGSTVQVDENYIRESILNPMVKIRQGYQGVMPTFQGKLEDKEITWIIAYIKTISGVSVEEVPAAETEQPEEQPTAAVDGAGEPDETKPATGELPADME